jgi:hypothetical protein
MASKDNFFEVAKDIAEGRARRILELEQQLAQAEENKQVLAGTINAFQEKFQTYKAELAQARALLEEEVERYTYSEAGTDLLMCLECKRVGSSAISHFEGCRIGKMSAFLAREEGNDGS